jgi:hypothetical protein
MKTSLSNKNRAKREQRAKATAEIFTPPDLVNRMLDKLPPEVWQPFKTYLDPACGNGNMLLEVLRRKLHHGHDPLQALATTFGADCMADNIKECRLRLLKLVAENGHEISRAMVIEVLNNIVVTPIGKKYPRGSLDYDFQFPRKVAESDKRLDCWMHGITERQWLESV